MKGLTGIIDITMVQIETVGYLLPEYNQPWSEKNKRMVTDILSMCLKTLMAARGLNPKNWPPKIRE